MATAKKSKKVDFSDPPATRFADVQSALDQVMTYANNPISDSPHGAFWKGAGVTRNSFVNSNVNMVTPEKSAFYVYLERGVMPQGGPNMQDEHPELLTVIKTWLNTGFH